MILSFISDTESPVVTAVSLNAVARNRNQFDYDKVRIEGDWIIYRDPETVGTCAYKVMSESKGAFKVAYRENGGGTLTTMKYISFYIESKSQRINGKIVSTKNLVVSGVDDKQVAESQIR